MKICEFMPVDFDDWSNLSVWFKPSEQMLIREFQFVLILGFVLEKSIELFAFFSAT